MYNGGRGGLRVGLGTRRTPPKRGTPSRNTRLSANRPGQGAPDLQSYRVASRDYDRLTIGRLRGRHRRILKRRPPGGRRPVNPGRAVICCVRAEPAVVLIGVWFSSKK